jgi:superoxide reductase
MLKRNCISATTLIVAVLAFGQAHAEGPFSKIQKGQDAKHTPIIEAPETVKAGEAFKVTVRVGEKMHPSDTGHFIQWIELYAGDVQLARVVTFMVMLQESTTLRALSAPNHSAAWEATRKITVKKAMEDSPENRVQ